MEQHETSLNDLYNRIPRRHSVENVQVINAILDEYTDILGEIEGINTWFEKHTAVFYTSLETIRSNLKMSTSNKHSKKAKDGLFDEASGLLKDDIQSLVAVFNDGKKNAAGE